MLGILFNPRLSITACDRLEPSLSDAAATPPEELELPPELVDDDIKLPNIDVPLDEAP